MAEAAAIGELLLIGIGTGNPDHVTGEAAHALRTADLVLIPRKGADKADLADLRRDICGRILGADGRLVEFDLPVRDASGDYLAGVDAWHDAIAAAWRAAAQRAGRALRGGAGPRVALLVWGDPSLYDSSLRIARRLDPMPRIRVVPGITALQALCAAHAIPFNTVGAPVMVTTGRRLRDRGWPEGVDRVAVMLDGGGAFQALDPAGVEIWWGAYLGMDNQVLIQGPLGEVGARILSTRAEARRAHGWIMDVYILHRHGGDTGAAR
ncbi:precorrin-6A synthase (deacetylating) [Rhodothalassium salexigens DSM 2132]|uniref:Precorrin-6A synthase [deacetylating] n=1 Tax=Rhodothalassium salexigens DSM 2132 TaxID=1188247 RepID=A0A4R2PGN5_RHOSA|nr:precorrin-6A synthase (deacetylating) [Rhodothalassium salexigens]MBB4211525.1 precorrin-6A synthase [Rhodothalassium salexigens DSM 2132]TCP34543.1 precorrin-6A synthase (deacetylating) [Rhodothalassium salexigens DSM 2132]